MRSRNRLSAFGQGSNRRKFRRALDGVRLHIEPLEDRRVLAVTGPSLAGITTNDGSLLLSGSQLEIAPNELTFVFSPGQTIDTSSLNGIQIVRSGLDGVFGGDDPDDVAIRPGFVGIGESPNEVIVRFSENLPDDNYEIRIGAVLNASGEQFNCGEGVTIPFELDLGAQVLAVVPQPVTRTSSGLQQARDTIQVYFNSDTLSESSAENVNFYQLTSTNDTVSNTDDGDVINPTSVVYSSETNLATLTFAQDLAELGGGTGTFRLRIGSNEAPLAPPVDIVLDAEPGSSFADASTAFGTLSSGSLIVSEFIAGIESGLIFPGSNNDPGHRRVSTFIDQHVPDGGFDQDPGIAYIGYNFDAVLGEDLSGTPLINTITPAQKQLTRQALEIFSHYLGVQFAETPSFGITIGTGDVRAVIPTAFTDPERVPGVSGIGTDGQFTTVINAAGQWSDDYGGNYFQEVMRQIGRSLGLGSANDLPEGTILGGNPELTFDIAPELIFPGDHDIVHGQYLFRPDANDIDMYRFVVPETGTVSIESFAERISGGFASPLDTQLRLYQNTPSGIQLVSQNDDYFSQDSYISRELQAGTYYVGVTAKGNDQYDPTVTDSGAGGLTEGEYELRIDYRPSADRTIVDETGKQLDGDLDGEAGGDFNFWFRATSVADTQFVDKLAPSGGTGSMSSPYRTITAALNAAGDGDVVRVIGNENLAYEVGFGTGNTALEDSDTDGLLKVPSGVTLVVDAGSIFKLQRGAIIVGTSSNFVDQSKGAIQVLGIPDNDVTFTSYKNETVANDGTPLATVAAKGDWGGIVIRNDFDQANGEFVYENEGIFLNYINFANISFGGGVVQSGLVNGVVNAITVIDARPTITNNTISRGADAAISASPNSFEESNFHDPKFQAQPFSLDYSRVGPQIHENLIVGNTINGMSIANRFPINDAATLLSVTARWDDTDIVHVIQDQLVVATTPGGLIGDVTTIDGVNSFDANSRVDGALIIDGGTIVKLGSASIEVQLGGTFLAEGDESQPVVFTSLQDQRYGASGAFNTSLRGSAAVPGDWGGIYLAPAAIGSFENVVIAYGGGSIPVTGSFTNINALEAHQADLRVVNSLFEFNDEGFGGQAEAERFGLGRNAAGTVFIAGAQPVILNNSFQFNESAAININVNSLNHHSVVDGGRHTGTINRIDQYRDNQGPLVRDNELTGNGINGMIVRGGTLTTESIWDDTDIVHVVYETIFVPNFHTYGGLRLKSSLDQSLVVKLLGGQSAGFVSTGSALGISDHVGGSMQVIGQPGRPVILTSLFDDTVGAGFDANGQIQVDTDGGGRPVRSTPVTGAGSFQIQLNYGPIISRNSLALEAARKAADLWEAQLQDPITVSIDVELSDIGGELLFEGQGINGGTNQFDTTVSQEFLAFNTVRNQLAADAGAHEPLLAQLPTLEEINFVFPGDSTNPFTLNDEMRLSRANAKALGFGTGLSESVSAFDVETDLDGTILINDNLENWDFDRKNGLETYREDFVTEFMTQIGSVLGFQSSLNFINGSLDNPLFGRNIPISPLDLFRFNPGDGEGDFTNATRVFDPTDYQQVFYAGGDLDFTNWSYEGMQVGEIPLATGFRQPNELGEGFGASFWHDNITAFNNRTALFAPIGIMDPVSGLRDEIIYELDPVQRTNNLIVDISEADRLAFDAIGYDVVGPTPGHWDGIRLEELTHDRNFAFFSERETPESPAPGPNGQANTAEFLGDLAVEIGSGNEDIRLGFEVHGILGSRTDVDVYTFNAQAGTEVWIDVDGTTSSLDTVVELVASNGTVLASSDNSIRELTDPTLLGDGNLAQPIANDIYTTNPRDAGMKLTLPGPSGLVSAYFVRVRSFEGDTSGRYELQIRLQEKDEVPGTSITQSDIRFAQNGIKLIGPPIQSPLVGEQVENGGFNDAIAESDVLIVDAMGMPQEDDTIFAEDLPSNVEAQFLGNLLATKQGAFNVFGNLSQFDDVDWYEIDLNYSNLSPPFAASFDVASDVGVVFDVDYTDGLGRPDTTVAVFDNVGQLVYYSDASNVAADQAGADLTNLRAGSVGTRDPFIGPVILTAGRDDTFGGFTTEFTTTYFIAVSSAFVAPSGIATNGLTLESVGGEFDTGRGFQVLDAVPNDSLYVDNSANAPLGGVLEGEYSLEIRTVPIPQGGFTTETIADGDQNVERAQGQINISQNRISDSLHWGISIVDGYRDLPFYLGDDAFNQQGNSDDPLELLTDERFRSQPHTQFTQGDYVPHSGTTRLLPNVNEERVVPGITIANNLVTSNWEGGLQLNGDPNGILLRTYDIESLTDLQELVSAGSLNNSQFTLWDQQGNTQTFQFTTSGDVTNPTYLPIRFDGTRMNDILHQVSTWAPISQPTSASFIAYEIEHRIRQSSLDVKVYRGENNSLFIEGAVEIGNVGVCENAGEICVSAFFPLNDEGGRALLPMITAEKVQQGSVLYSRIVNNTFVGRGGTLTESPGQVGGIGDIGIQIEDNSSPTLLNNIIANFTTGIHADESSTDQNLDVRTFIGSDLVTPQDWFRTTSILQEDFSDEDFVPLGFQGLFGTFANEFQDFRDDNTPFVGNNPTVVGGTIYQGNRDNTERIGAGDFAISLGIDDPLFVDAANRNYFLADGSAAIDSSISSLAERTSLNETLSSVGLQSFGIEAPTFDVFGIRRIDDPRVEPPGGLGSNVFVDRGALERADFVGPTAIITAPADNDGQGIDQDPTINSVAVGNLSLSEFVISLSDSGTAGFGSGIDDASVVFSAVILIRDGVVQTQGEDYTISYNALNDTIRLLPAAGIWPADSIYTITLDNTVITDSAGNALAPNSTDGSTTFFVQTGVARDFGDAPAPYPTLRQDNGARHAVTSLFLGSGVDLDPDGTPGAPDSFDDGVVFNSSIIAGSVLSLTVTASESATLNGWIDFNGDGVWSGIAEQILIDRQVSAGTNSFTVPVPNGAVLGDTWTRFRVSSQTGLNPVGEAVDGEVEDYLVTVSENPWTNPSDAFDVSGDGIVTPIDAIQVINELNDPRVRDPATGRLPLDIVPDGIDPNFFFDVNGDGFVSPTDALLIINRLNGATSASLVAPLSSSVSAATREVGLLSRNQSERQNVEANGVAEAPLTAELDEVWADHEFATNRARRDAIGEDTLTTGEIDGVLDDLATDVANAWEQLS